MRLESDGHFAHCFPVTVAGAFWVTRMLVAGRFPTLCQDAEGSMTRVNQYSASNWMAFEKLSKSAGLTM